MKDNQIIQESWFDAMTRKASEDFDKLSIRKKSAKPIPVKVYEEVFEYFSGCELATSFDGRFHMYKVTTQKKGNL